MNNKVISNLLIILLVFVFFISEARSNEFVEELAGFSLEELMQMDITTASKTQQKLFETPSAVYVITSEDIKRSGARNIPDALRIVPGVEVGQINSNQWAVGIRGFNSDLANKLLVLVDGRSVYTPLFAGVFWVDIDTLIEDIDRIEVIRGPGGSIWGANAVNGVINIITKDSKDTKGVYVNAGFGNEEKAFAAARYGGSALDDKLNYRFFIKAFDKDDFEDNSGAGANDDWKSYRGGFRADFTKDSKNKFSLISDIYKIDATRPLGIPNTTPPEFEELFIVDAENKGFSIIGRWEHLFSDGSEFSFQFYYDYFDRFTLLAGEKRHTIDFETVHNFETSFITSHELIWGLGFRLTTDDVISSEFLSINDTKQTNELYSAFIQDKIKLIDEKLFLILGAKFEHNDFTGFEFQPNAKLLFTPNENNTLWFSASRAVRSPSRVERGVTSLVAGFVDPFTNLPALVFVDGNEDFDSEELYAIEFGYRTKPRSWITLDLAFFYNHYNDLELLNITETNIALNPVNHLRVIAEFENELEADAYGFELASNFIITRFWKLKFNYSFLELDTNDRSIVQTGEDSANLVSRFSEEFSPKHQVKAQSFLDITDNLKFDTSLYWVDDIKTIGLLDIPAYTRVDVRLSYSPIKEIELSLVGQNIFDDSHKEFGSTILGDNTNIQRSIFGSITWRR